MSTRWSAWEYRDGFATLAAEAMVGYAVEAVDGVVGTVSEATTRVGSSHLIVDSSQAGETVVLPVGIISDIDPDAHRIVVDRSRDEIAKAPGLHRDIDKPSFDDSLSQYYGGYYWTGPADALSPQARAEATESEDG